MRGEAKKARINLKIAKSAANAARLNAQAVMDAEGSHLYPVIKGDNLRTNAFRGGALGGAILYGETSSNDEKVEAPNVTYCLQELRKNFGRLGFRYAPNCFLQKPSKSRDLIEAGRPLEIIGADNESSDLGVQMDFPFNMGDAKALIEGAGELLFFGEATFTDFLIGNSNAFGNASAITAAFAWFGMSNAPALRARIALACRRTADDTDIYLG